MHDKKMADSFMNKKIKNLIKNWNQWSFKNNAKNSKIKDIVKVIESLENRGVFSKGTTKKSITQEVRSLLLMKNILTPLAKSVLVPLGLTAAATAATATDAAI